MARRLLGAVAGAAFMVLLGASASAQLPAVQDRPMSAPERIRMASLEVQFARISARHNTSVAALRTIARAMGGRLTSQDPDQVLKAVEERAEELSKSRERISELEKQLEALDSMSLAKAVGPMLSDARQAIDQGRLDEAEAKLKEAGDRFAQARGNLQGRVDTLAVQEADIYAQRGAVRSSISDFKGAADLYGQAADLAPGSNPQVRWRYLMAEAQALHNQGDLFGEPASIARSVDLLKTRALPLAPRAERPDDWAATAFKLGVGQANLGYNRNDNAMLQDGIASIRNAVELTSRERAPEDWVNRRIRLGAALSMLADRTDTVAPIEEALAVFREAAAAHPQSGPDFYRAYGVALGRQGIWLEHRGRSDEATEAFKKSAEAFRAGTAQVDAAANPRLAGDLYNNLSFALKLLASRLHDKAYIRQSIDAATAGLKVVDRERLPMVWATLQRRYGWGLIELEELDPATDDAGLTQGIEALRGTLAVVTREKAPSLWGAIEQDLAQGLQMQGEHQAGAAALDPAIAAYRASCEVLTVQVNPGAWAENQVNIGELLAEQGRRLNGAERKARYEDAKATFAAARPVLEKLDDEALATRMKASAAAVDAALIAKG